MERIIWIYSWIEAHFGGMKNIRGLGGRAYVWKSASPVMYIYTVYIYVCVYWLKMKNIWNQETTKRLTYLNLDTW